jgi:hypothetical protein
MKCENKAEVWVERGFHGKFVEIPCGMTGPEGTVELCTDCLAKMTQVYPQGWRHRPGDICCHGTYLNPEHDCNCYKCEDGIGREFELTCYCGASIWAPLEYEVDCDRCGQVHTMPASEELVKQYNADVAKEIESVKYTGKIRIMRIDECGHESCVCTVDNDTTLQYVLAGVEATYPESKVFTEPEENMRHNVEQHFLDEGY